MNDIQIVVPKYTDFKKEIILFDGIEDISPVKIILPDPPNKNKVVNYKRPASSQMWEKVPLPKSFLRFKNLANHEIYNLLTKDEHAFIRGEYKKLEEGYWIYINGELIWITNHHYMFLNWWKIDIGSPDYRDANRKFFLHFNKAENDQRCYGLIEMTNRRDGKSVRAGVIAYCRTFSYENRYAGIQSKTSDDAKKFFQKTVVSPWKKLPFFFKPNYDSSNNPREELRFYAPTRRGKDSQLKLGKEVSLESWIEARASVTTAFDGEKLHTSIIDEAGKTIEINVSDRWDITKVCQEQGRDVIGKAIMTTTVEEMEKGGGAAFKSIWDDSDPTQLNELGSTKSGLHRHFTPAYDGYIVDKYGRSLINESMAALQKERDGLRNNPHKLSALKRKKPFTIRECFRSMGRQCYFDIEIIDTRLEFFTFSNPFVTQGNFKWKDDKSDTEVIFVPCGKEHAKFNVSYLFDKPEQANKYIIRGGKRFPNNISWGMAGGDPFKYDIVSDTRQGSFGGGSVFMNRDILIDPDDKEVSKWETDRFCCSYKYRPKRKDIYGEDMLMMCIYYGIYMFPETDVDLIWDYFNERGYGGYLYYQKDEHGRVSRQPGAHTNDRTKEAIFAECESYIERRGAYERHPEILEAFREADKENLSPHDLFVACGYAILGARKSFKKISHTKDTKNPLFYTFEVQ